MHPSQATYTQCGCPWVSFLRPELPLFSGTLVICHQHEFLAAHICRTAMSIWQQHIRKLTLAGGSRNVDLNFVAIDQPVERRLRLGNYLLPNGFVLFD